MSETSSTRSLNDAPAHRRLGAVSITTKVPAVAAAFWVTKLLTTAFGESTSDYLVHVLPPVIAVVLGFIAFCAALVLQLGARRYVVWRYWLAVAMVGVFGTMAADVLHVGFHVPYLVSAIGFLVVLAAVFASWHRVEGTVSVHTITTTRRELFYWAAVVTTFALGTAAGDLAASVGGLGYLAAIVGFAALIVVPAVGYRFGHLNPVVAFWAAYVLTRPVGASLADWLGKPTGAGGVGVGPGPVAAVLGVCIVAAVVLMSRGRATRPAREPALGSADRAQPSS